MSKTFDLASHDARVEGAPPLVPGPTGRQAVNGFFVSLGLIFVAELGDKSQLMALTFAARYKALTILAAITVATAFVHLFSVAIGELIGAALPTHAISIVAGVAFIGFALWTLRGDELDEDDEARGPARRRDPSSSPSRSAFFLAELGDKTMLATVTLAADHGWFGVWLGSTLGMVAADALAIVVGAQLGARLPQKVVKIAAAATFVVFGVLLIIEGVS